jgi:hypothetical protein
MGYLMGDGLGLAHYTPVETRAPNGAMGDDLDAVCSRRPVVDAGVERVEDLIVAREECVLTRCKRRLDAVEDERRGSPTRLADPLPLYVFTNRL